MSELLQLVDQYAVAFPFAPFSDDDIGRLKENYNRSISPLLLRCLHKLGSGNFSLTGGFFQCDSELESTILLRSTLSHHHTVEKDLREYVSTGHELVIGSTDALTFFTSDASAEDPSVYCHIETRGVSQEKAHLSEIVNRFRCFRQPYSIPQSFVDWEWYQQKTWLR